MSQATTLEATTRAPCWSATETTPIPAQAQVQDLMTASTVAIELRKSAHEIPALVEPDVVAGFDAVFEWAMRQDFDDDHAARVRREAWGRRETR
jgi:hypothetical protein